MTDKREPLDSQILTGYMLSKARVKYLKYTNQALDCLEQALKDTNKDLDDEVVQNVDLGEIRSYVYEALAAVERVEIAHKALSEGYQDLGYRKLTTEDFRRFGGTRR